MFPSLAEHRAPEFVTELEAQAAAMNSAVTFECSIDGRPAPDVRWFRNGVQLTPNENVQLLRAPGSDRVQLCLLHVSEDDAGLYTCEVANAGGKKTSSAPLSVLCKLTFSLI